MYKILKKIVTLFHFPISDEKLRVFSQFVKFGLVGLSNTAISYITYVICVYLGMHYFFANTLGFIISVLNSFYIHMRKIRGVTWYFWAVQYLMRNVQLYLMLKLQ